MECLNLPGGPLVIEAGAGQGSLTPAIPAGESGTRAVLLHKSNGENAGLISKEHSYCAFGASWTSRILQEALAWMLDDSATQALVHEAAGTYRQKSAMFTRALRAHGVSTPEAAGLEIVVNVRDEEFARGYLKASGIAVQPGKQFCNGDRLR